MRKPSKGIKTKTIVRNSHSGTSLLRASKYDAAPAQLAMKAPKVPKKQIVMNILLVLFIILYRNAKGLQIARNSRAPLHLLINNLRYIANRRKRAKFWLFSGS